MNGSTEKKKTGINLFRIGILIFCIISFLNTGKGLRDYVFGDTPAFAYMISLVFQIIIAVGSLKYEQIYQKYSAVYQKKESAAKNGAPLDKERTKGKKSFRKKYLNLMSFPIIVSFIMSIIFDFIFIVNSTYNITLEDEQLIGVVSEFTSVKSDISKELFSYTEYYRDVTFNNIEALRDMLPKTRMAVFAKDWNAIWDDDAKKYIRSSPDISMYDVAKNLLQYENRAPEDMSIAGNTDEDKYRNANDYVARYAADDVNAYMLQINETFRAFKPEKVTPTHVEEFKELLHQVKTHFNAIIKLEKGETDFEDESAYAGNDDIFVNLAAQYGSDITALDTKVNKLIEQEQDKNNPLPIDPNDEKNRSTQRREAEWERDIRNRAIEMFSVMSKAHIQNCKNAIADIERYEQIVSSIEADPIYNIAALTAEISESKVIEFEKIDEITGKIAQALFIEEKDQTPESSDNGNVASPSEKGNTTKVGKFVELKSNLASYVPLKNIDYLSKNMKLMSEQPAADKEAKKSEKGKTTVKFDQAVAKESFDALIEQLSFLSEDIKINDNIELAETTPSRADAELSVHRVAAVSSTETEDELQNKIADIINRLFIIEDKYLIKKNPMIAAAERLVGKNYTKTTQGEITSVRVADRRLAVFAAIFAIFVDVISLLLGRIVQAWEKK